jgi:branched-chain amino acid transport system substrate-binding protein
MAGSRGTGPPSAAAILIVSFTAALVACEPHRPVVLGVVTAPPYVDAARLAVEEALAQSPLPGFDTIMIPQGQNLASPAIEAARRLVDAEGLIAVIGHSNSAASLATAPIYNERRVVQIAPTASAAVYSQAGPFSFRLVPPDDRQGRFLAKYLRTTFRGGARVAVAYVNDEYGRGLHAALRAELDTAQYPVVLELPHVEDDVADADLAYGATALRAARPEVIVWLARGGILARFITPIRAVLPRVPIVGSDAVGAGGLSNEAAAVAAGMRYVDYADLMATEELRAFSARYHARFGYDPTVASALTYDAVRLVIAGIRAGAHTGNDLRSYLTSLGGAAPPFAGVTGPIAFDANGDVGRSYVLKTLGAEDAR